MRGVSHVARLLGTKVAAWLDAERDHWFVWAPVAFGGGIAVYFALPNEPDPWVAVCAVGLASALWLAGRRNWLASAVAAALMAAAFGFAVAKLRTEMTRAPLLAREIGPVEITGVVEQVEPRAGRGVRVTLWVAAIAGLDADQRPHRVRLRLGAPHAKLKPGDAIRVKAILAPPQSPTLPGGYNFARAAWFERLGGVGYATGRPVVDAAAAPPPGRLRAVAFIANARKAVGERVSDALPGQSGAIARALVTGERGGIDAETNGAYKASGLFHVLSISGLHMVVMAGSVFFFVRLSLAALPALALRFPIKKWSASVGVLGVIGYLLLSGAAFASVRSALMIAVAFLAILIDRPAIALRNVAIAALAILALWPESLLDAGFQMSFAAVVALVASYEAIRRRTQGSDAGRPNILLRVPMFFGGILLSTLVAGLAVAPFTIHHFHQTQQYALLANLLAIPICNMVVMPSALATLLAMPFGLERAPLWAMGHGIDAMTWCAHAVAGLKGASLRVPAIPLSAFACMVGGGLWLALWRTRARVVGLLPIAVGLALAPGHPAPDVLVGADGRLVAARGADGRLAALPAERSVFELSRWLEHDGDSRTAKETTNEGAFSCDAIGCVTTVKGLTVAVTRHPAALADDCAQADIVIVRAPKPRGCTRPRAVVDIFAIKALGAHALYIEENGEVRVETVRTAGQSRPWAELPAWAKSRVR